MNKKQVTPKSPQKLYIKQEYVKRNNPMTTSTTLELLKQKLKGKLGSPIKKIISQN